MWNTASGQIHEMSPLSQSILFGLPLVCGALALILGAVFRSVGRLRIPLVILSAVAGLAACTLIIFGLQATPKMEIYQSGFRTLLSSTGDTDQAGIWAPVPWALPRTAGPALEISGVGGINQKRQLLARQTSRGRGQLFVDFPGSPRKRVNLRNCTTPIESKAEILRNGEKTSISWKTENDEEQIVIRNPDGSTDTIRISSLSYPKAWQFPDSKQSDMNRSGLFLTRLPKDRGERAHILVLDPNLMKSKGTDDQGSLVVDGKPFVPDLNFASDPEPDFLRVTRWNTVRNRF
ncbi:MAG: hypothetical protein P1V20_31335, partial [Verrucomicrobiales bacterium]|nr:hypothetical protein [Verrucomicrobiales bacterium]